MNICYKKTIILTTAALYAASLVFVRPQLAVRQWKTGSTLAPRSIKPMLQTINETMNGLQRMIDDIAAVSRELAALSPGLYSSLIEADHAALIKDSLPWHKRYQIPLWFSIVGGASTMALAVSALIALSAPPVWALAAASLLDLMAAGTFTKQRVSETAPVRNFMKGLALKVNEITAQSDKNAKALYDNEPFSPEELSGILFAVRNRPDLTPKILKRYIADRRWQVRLALVIALVAMHRDKEIKLNNALYEDIISGVLNKEKRPEVFIAAVAGIDESTPSLREQAAQILLDGERDDETTSTAAARFAQLKDAEFLIKMLKQFRYNSEYSATAKAAIEGLAAIKPGLCGFNGNGTARKKKTNIDNAAYEALFPLCAAKSHFPDDVKEAAVEAALAAIPLSPGHEPSFAAAFTAWCDKEDRSPDPRLAAALIGHFKDRHDTKALAGILTCLSGKIWLDPDGSLLRQTLTAAAGIDPLLSDEALRMSCCGLYASGGSSDARTREMLRGLLAAHIQAMKDSVSSEYLAWWGGRVAALVNDTDLLEGIMAQAKTSTDLQRAFFGAALAYFEKLKKTQFTGLLQSADGGLALFLEHTARCAAVLSDKTMTKSFLNMYLRAREACSTAPSNASSAQDMRKRLDSCVVTSLEKADINSPLFSAMAERLNDIYRYDIVFSAFIARSIESGSIETVTPLLRQMITQASERRDKDSITTVIVILQTIAESELLSDPSSNKPLVTLILSLAHTELSPLIRAAALNALGHTTAGDGQTIAAILDTACAAAAANNAMRESAFETIGLTLQRSVEWAIRSELQKPHAVELHAIRNEKRVFVSTLSPDDIMPLRPTVFSAEQINEIIKWLHAEGFFDPVGPGYYYGKRFAARFSKLPLTLADDQKTALAWILEHAPLYVSRGIEGAEDKTRKNAPEKEKGLMTSYKNAITLLVAAIPNPAQSESYTKNNALLGRAAFKALSMAPLVPLHAPEQFMPLFNSALTHTKIHRDSYALSWALIVFGRMITHYQWYAHTSYWANYSDDLHYDSIPDDISKLFDRWNWRTDPFKLLQEIVQNAPAPPNPKHPYTGNPWRCFDCPAEELTPEQAAAQALSFNIHYLGYPGKNEPIWEAVFSIITDKETTHPGWREWGLRVIETADPALIDTNDALSNLRRGHTSPKRGFSEQQSLRIVTFLITMAARGKYERIRKTAREALKTYPIAAFTSNHAVLLNELIAEERAALPQRIANRAYGTEEEWQKESAITVSFLQSLRADLERQSLISAA